LVTGKLFSDAAKSVEAVKGTNPEYSSAIFIDGTNLIMTQAIRVFQVVLVMGKPLGGGIKSIEPAAPGSNPEYARVIFINEGNMIITQTVGVIRIMFIDSEAITVVLIQPILCPEPHKSFSVL